jgi:hypothetical protein
VTANGSDQPQTAALTFLRSYGFTDGGATLKPQAVCRLYCFVMPPLRSIARKRRLSE